jgi:hypothetical protein
LTIEFTHLGLVVDDSALVKDNEEDDAYSKAEHGYDSDNDKQRKFQEVGNDF